MSLSSPTSEVLSAFDIRKARKSVVEQIVEVFIGQPSLLAASSAIIEASDIIFLLPFAVRRAKSSICF